MKAIIGVVIAILSGVAMVAETVNCYEKETAEQ